MALKWYQQIDIVDRQATATRSKMESALDSLAEKQRQNREEEEARLREQGLASGRTMLNYLETMNWHKAAGDLKSAGIELSEGAVRKQISSGFSWAQALVEQQDAEAKQASRAKVVKKLLDSREITYDDPTEKVELHIQQATSRQLMEDAFIAGNYDLAKRYQTQAEQYVTQIEDWGEVPVETPSQEGLPATTPETREIAATIPTTEPTIPQASKGKQVLDSLKSIATSIWRGLPFNPEYWMNPEQKQLADYKRQLLAFAQSQGVENPEEWVNNLTEQKTGEVTMTARTGQEKILNLPSPPSLEQYLPPTVGAMGERATKGEQFIGEWVMPAVVLSFLPSAGVVRGTLGTAAKAGGAVGKAAQVGRAVLKPVELYEQAWQQAFKYTVGQFPKLGAKVTETVARHNFDNSTGGKRMAGIWGGKDSPQYKTLYKIWRLDQKTPPQGQAGTFYQDAARKEFDFWYQDTKFREGIDKMAGRVKPETTTPKPPPTETRLLPTGEVAPTQVTPRVTPTPKATPVTEKVTPEVKPTATAEKVTAPETKQPWQMTLEEYIAPFRNKKGEINPQVAGGLRGNHRADVSAALTEGKPVPAEVLKDYPDLKPATTEAIPKAQPGMPEAGLQLDMSGKTTPVMPKGKAGYATASMEDYAKLQALKGEEELDIEARAAQEELGMIREFFGTDPIANYTVHVGGKKVHLDYFLKNGDWPESFTVKEAAALMQKPVASVTSRIKKGGIATDRVESAYVLDEISEQFKMGEEQFIGKLREIYNLKQRAHRLGIMAESVKVTPDEAIKVLRDVRQTVMEAGGIKFPSFVNPEESMRAALKEAGVAIPAKPIRKGLFTTLGLSPQRVVTRSDPNAAKITELGRQAYADYESAVLEGADRASASFNGLTLPEMEKLIEWQESGQLTPEFISSLPAKYQKAINEGIRWFNKEIKRIATDEFKIDTSKWGYTEENYFHHLFLGDQMLKVGDKTVAIGKLADLYTKVEELIAQGTPPADISIVPKFSQTDIPTTLLSRKGFWSFVSRLAKDLEVSKDDILAEMHGVAGIKPRPKFVGAFEQRKANLEGYLKDPRRVYTILWDRIQRKRYLEPFTKQATDLVGKINTPWLKTEVQDYIANVGGKYIEPTYFHGINLSKLATVVTKAQSIMKMGGRLSTAFVNRLQALQMSYPELGNYYFKGAWKRHTPEGRAILAKMNLQVERPKYTTGGFEERAAGRVKWYHPLKAFTMTEKAVREETGLGGYYMATDKLRMSEADAIRFGENLNDTTMLRYDVSDLPKVFRNPIGRMAFQFKPFVIGYVSNALDVITGKPLAGMEEYGNVMYANPGDKAKRGARFFGMNFVVGGLKTITRLFTPFGVGLVTYLAIKHPDLFKGMFSYVGVDISERAGASPFDVIPQDIWDLAGLAAGDVQRVYSVIKKYETSENPKDLLEIMRIAPQVWSIYRAFAEEEGVPLTQYEKLLIALGFEPTRISDIKAGMRYINYTQATMKTPANSLPTEAALQNIVYYVQNYPKQKREVGETNKQYADRIDHETKRREICLEILDRSSVTPDKYSYYLMKRRERLG